MIRNRELVEILLRFQMVQNIAESTPYRPARAHHHTDFSTDMVNGQMNPFQWKQLYLIYMSFVESGI